MSFRAAVRCASVLGGICSIWLSPSRGPVQNFATDISHSFRPFHALHARQALLALLYGPRRFLVPVSMSVGMWPHFASPQDGVKLALAT